MYEHRDVLIIGAGLAGIGAACHLSSQLPGKSYAILEARETIGGTWDLFRYPGIRSDSSMYAMAYSFKPWPTRTVIAEGESIRDYIREAAAEHGVAEHIRYGHRVLGAEWDSTVARWTVDVELPATDDRVKLTCSFLHFCTGYYRYDSGFTPQFTGADDFRGRIVHPQHWPEDLDYSGQRVVVIGSGATAVTVVPAMAETAEHVTMLQRSPGYVISLPADDTSLDRWRRLLPHRAAYGVVRAKVLVLMVLFYQLSRRRPEMIKSIIRKGVENALPEGYDIDTHFTPRYEPWDQRMCVVPNGDLFEALGSGRASVVTDEIDRFTETGLRLKSGAELEADIIVTATGLNLELFGGVELAVDGREVSISDLVTYKGMMYGGLPNLALMIPYGNSAWTLKADLVARYVCRLLRYMDERSFDYCMPLEPGSDQQRAPLLNLNSGYVMRALDQLPKQAERAPWRVHQNYFLDLKMLRRASLQDDGIRFARAARVPVAAAR
jgi:cation diffusion facilitator CzcD-associated flavoprotein CzcO